MLTNLRMSIVQFAKEREEQYLTYKGKHPHMDQRYEQGWVPVMQAYYAPAHDRFYPTIDFSKEIVETLEKDGMFAVRDKDCMNIEDFEKALSEVLLHVPEDIENIIWDHRTYLLMIDRKAFSNNGINEHNVQFYLRRCGFT